MSAPAAARAVEWRLRSPLGSHLVARRTAMACGGLLAAALVLAVLGLCQGETWVSPVDAVTAFLGYGESAFVVTEWRAPRVAAGLVLGTALGAAGAVFQNLTRNPLGSPDIIGLDAGAYTGALVAITVLQGTAAQLAGLSVLAGLVTAAVVFLLARRSGFSGMRLVIIGIAVNAMLTAVNSWIVLRAELDVAIAATVWSSGSLNGLDWDEVLLPFGVIAFLVLVLVALAPGLHQSTLGDPLAQTTGVRLEPLRALLVLVGVGCTATVTAVAGPIVFIALAAPQVGRRLAGAAGVPLLPAMLTGAVLLLGADIGAQVLFAPIQLPVGVVSTAIGGGYLIWLLCKEVSR